MAEGLICERSEYSGVWEGRPEGGRVKSNLGGGEPKKAAVQNVAKCVLF